MLASMNRLTDYLLSESVEKLTLKNTLHTRCPFTGQTMKLAVDDNEGISYEEENIKAWLQTQNTSPVSGKKLTVEMLVPNRDLREVIHELTSSDKFEVLLQGVELNTFRAEYTIHHYCRFRSDRAIEPKARVSINKFISELGTRDWWPAVDHPWLMSTAIWDSFSILRSTVYGEFTQVQNPGVEHNRLPNANQFTLQNAKKYFIDAMYANFTDTKVNQINTAIGNFCKWLGYTHNAGLETRRNERWLLLFDILQDKTPHVTQEQSIGYTDPPRSGSPDGGFPRNYR